MKALKWLIITALLLTVIYFLGPAPSAGSYDASMPAVPAIGGNLDEYVRQKESRLSVKPDNEARIIWADSSKSKTDYAIVYLHGFSASQEEGDPVHTKLAEKLGANLYLSRLDAHGLGGPDQLLTMTATRLYNSALEALAIGKQLGNKVILVGTSTGGTLALKLASQYPEIAGLTLLSPNIEIKDPNAWVLNNHWGLQIARMVVGKYRQTSDTTELYARYWNNRYRMEGAVQLQELLEGTMKKSVFEKIKQPVLMLYYYKDENNQDDVVSVEAMKRMFDELGTQGALKKEVALPNTGDHVIGSYVKSKDVEGVVSEINKFIPVITGK